VLLVLGIGAWLWYLNDLTGNIEKFALTLPEEQRPQLAPTEALNILVAGADNGPGPSIAEDVAAGVWEPDQHRSDTIMIMHVSADRQRVSLVSIPRDAYVEIYDENGMPTGKAKINDAFSQYGPSGYVSTVEHLTGLRMDHLAIMDWAGFRDLTTALGGVEVYIPETFYDQSQKITWEQGNADLEGQRALQYVRTRYGLINGDFDRIKRQQNFLRAMMDKLISNGTTANPVRLTRVLKVVVANLTVSDDWATSDIRSLALSLRGISSDDVTFVTAPLGSYDTTRDGAEIVRLAQPDSQQLWSAIADGQLRQWAAAHKDSRLGKAQNVS
jgi:LCP family protein required for cell wall assembly